LHGNVFGHPRFADGHPVTTSRIVGKNSDDTVVTYSGNVYELGEVDPAYEEMFPNARDRVIGTLDILNK